MKIRRNPIVYSIIAFGIICWGQPGKAEDSPLKASAPIALSGKAAKFDFMTSDFGNGRILAAHKGAGALSVLDTQSEKPLGEIPVGHAQGVVVDARSGQYIVGDDDEHKLVIIDAKTLKQTGEVQVDGEVDAIELDSKNGMIYADEGDGKRIWVVDPQAKKVVKTIAIPGGPEVLAYDSVSDRLYQNIKNKDLLVVINPATNQIEASWPTAPATGPHGLVIDSESGRALVAGHNGKLVSIELKSGKVIASIDIAPNTDQIAFDSKTKTVYCASKGFISVVEETPTGLRLLGNVPSPAGAHTLAVDEAHHQLWISYADAKHSYLQKFEAAK